MGDGAVTRLYALALVSSLAACGGGADGGDRTPSIDASRGHPDGSSSGSATHDAPHALPTAPVHTLFINTEGVTITAGSTDATQNMSDIVLHDATLKPWMMGDANRAAKIADFMTELQTIVAPYDVTIVNTRPASGDYDMFVTTDSDGTAAGYSAGQGGIAAISCASKAKAVALQFVPPYASSTDDGRKHNFGAYALGTFGIASGIPQSNVYGDCMCYSGQQCGQITEACHIGGPGTVVDTQLCTGSATMDEAAIWTAAFGPHP